MTYARRITHARRMTHAHRMTHARRMTHVNGTCTLTRICATLWYRYAPYDKYFGMSGSAFRFLVEKLPPIPVKPVSFLVSKGLKVGLVLLALNAGYNAVGGVTGASQVCASGDGREIAGLVKRVVFEGVGSAMVKVGKILQEM